MGHGDLLELGLLHFLVSDITKSTKIPDYSHGISDLRKLVYTRDHGR